MVLYGHLSIRRELLDVQERWSRMASVNAYSGAVHPLVHRHPISGKKERRKHRETWRFHCVSWSKLRYIAAICSSKDMGLAL